MKYTVNGKEHEIITVVHHKQCRQYYDALKKGDGVGAHLLYIPPWHMPLDMIEHEMKMIEIETTYEYEMERIENMPPELLKIETEMKLGIKDEPRKRVGIFDFLFSS